MEFFTLKSNINIITVSNRKWKEFLERIKYFTYVIIYMFMFFEKYKQINKLGKFIEIILHPINQEKPNTIFEKKHI